MTERDIEAHRWTPHLVGGMVLAIVLALTASRSGKVVEQLERSVETAGEVESDADVERMGRYTGLDWVIIDYLRRNVPPGTPVRTVWHGREARRIMIGFWHALLPTYPIRDDAELTILLLGRVGPEEEILARGVRFALVRRLP